MYGDSYAFDFNTHLIVYSDDWWKRNKKFVRSPNIPSLVILYSCIYIDTETVVATIIFARKNTPFTI